VSNSDLTRSSVTRQRSRFARVAIGAMLAGVLGTSGMIAIATASGASVNTPGSYSTTLYVDENGSGSECSQSAPCDSITQAADVAYDEGDIYDGPVTIDVGPGYFVEDAYFSNSDEFEGNYVPQFTVNGVPNETVVVEEDSEADAAILNDCANLTISGVTFAESDVGVANICGTLTLENDSFADNTTGISAYDDDGYTNTKIMDSSFYDEETGADLEGDIATVTNSTFSDQEGGIYTEGDDAYVNQGQLNVTNSTFNNEEYAILGDDASVGVQNDTIAYNSYGLYDTDDEYPSTFDVQGTILDDNSDWNCWQDEGGYPEGVVDQGYNVDTDGSCNTSTSTGSVLYTDPNVGPLQDNGGFTWTQSITPSSVAYHLVPAADCPTTDQRGESRPNPSTSGFCDAGAYEYAPAVSLAFVTTPQTGITSDGGNIGAITVQAIDADGLPAVSTHAIQLELSSDASAISENSYSFSESVDGEDTNIVTIPSGWTETSFFFGDETPGTYSVTVQGWDDIVNLGQITQDETVVVGPPEFMYIEGGNDQSTDVGTSYANPLSVYVTDEFGNPVPDSNVEFSVTSGGSTFAGSETTYDATTDSDGDATAGTLTAGTVPGPVVVSATDGDASTTFDLTQLVGPPSIITVEEGNSQSAISDQAFSTPLEVLLTDEYGNVIDDAQVNFAITSGDANFSGSATESADTNVSGDASVTDLTAGNHGGPVTITATANGYPAVTTTFSGISVTPLMTNSTVSSFAIGKSTLSAGLQKQIRALATSIATYGDTSVVLDGYADDSGTKALNNALSLARATAVKTYLLAQLKVLKVTGVTVKAVGKGATNFIGKPTAAVNRRVTAAAS
jgi:outer membrane protein OmpA-like peptidoglycan-associated protein